MIGWVGQRTDDELAANSGRARPAPSTFRVPVAAPCTRRPMPGVRVRAAGRWRGNPPPPRRPRSPSPRPALRRRCGPSSARLRTHTCTGRRATAPGRTAAPRRRADGRGAVATTQAQVGSPFRGRAGVHRCHGKQARRSGASVHGRHPGRCRGTAPISGSHATPATRRGGSCHGSSRNPPPPCRWRPSETFATRAGSTPPKRRSRSCRH